MTTTIQISEELQEILTKKKLSDRETYEEVIWALIEDTQELSENAKKEIEQSRKDMKKGKFYTLSEAKKKLGL